MDGKLFLNHMNFCPFLLWGFPVLKLTYVKYGIHHDSINNIYSGFVSERLKIACSTLEGHELVISRILREGGKVQQYHSSKLFWQFFSGSLGEKLHFFTIFLLIEKEKLMTIYDIKVLAH